MSPAKRSSTTDWALSYEPGPRPRLYNVVLVVVDDLSARFLRAFGHEWDTAPHLERRLATGTLFRSCHTPVGWTLPACASIVTGQLPDDHGLTDHNEKFRRPKLGHYLGREYVRAGIVNNGNVVTDTIAPEELESLGLKRRPAKWRSFGWDDGFDRYEWTHREDHLRPFTLAREFLSSLPSSSPGKPYFLFLHSNVVHDYHMDREYYLDVREWIGEEIHPALRSVPDGPDVWRTRPSGLTWRGMRRHLVAKYCAGIRYVDAKIEEVLGLVNFDDTIVVVASDHGEGFEPERGRVHHCGRLHCDLTHVPLAVWLPQELKARYAPPAVEERFCSTVDIVPSILTLLGDAVDGFPGRFLFDLPVHRRLEGSDRGYIYWGEDCVRESYDTCRIEIRSELTYPLKTISVRKNDSVKELAYNLAYDPGEQENLVAPLPKEIEGSAPLTFVVAVNDPVELAHNLLASPVARSCTHEWLLVENAANARYDSISRLYTEALERARNDLVVFVHQDVYLPPGWEAQFFRALAALEAEDARWGVIGPVGALPVQAAKPKELRGHWCDPSGYYRVGPLPHAVEALDEQILVVRKRSGIRFDPKLPGFHCYGIDLSLTARAAGRASYAIDAFAWHKYRDSEGRLVARREDSPKIRRRWGEEFMKEFQPAADYVERKWHQYLPFQTTSWRWGAG